MNAESTGALRTRRWRARENSGATYAAGDIPCDLAITLIEQGFLSDTTSLDPKARFDALIAYAEQAGAKLKKYRDTVTTARSM